MGFGVVSDAPAIAYFGTLCGAGESGWRTGFGSGAGRAAGIYMDVPGMSETNFNSQPIHRRARFNFDAFDKLCAEAIAEDSLMAEQGQAYEEEQAWAEHDRVFLGKRPGEIGGVACQASVLPDPPEAA